MKECRLGIYRDNSVVTHKPIMCFGGFGQPACKYIKECTSENGIKLRKRNK